MAGSQGSPLPRASSPTRSPTHSPRSASVSLQAAATVNAGLQREPYRQSSRSSMARTTASPHASRRRSTVLMNLHLNDPSLPAPGEMAHDQSANYHSSPPPLFPGPPLMTDSHHHRAPSLGELHQELEAEQEAHVNRLLQMIRQQQLELQRLQAGRPPQNHDATGDESAVLDSRDRPLGGNQPTALPAPVGPCARSPGLPHPRSSFDMARAELHRRSRTPSRGASPRLRATSMSADSGDWVLGGRDESAFYQAETQMLMRENQMMRHRIRDLEKQLADVSAGATSATEPAMPSQLTRSSTAADEGGDKEA